LISEGRVLRSSVLFHIGGKRICHSCEGFVQAAGTARGGGGAFGDAQEVGKVVGG